MSGRDHQLSVPAGSATARRDQIVVLAALLAVAGLAWGYTIWLSGRMAMTDMPGMPGMRMDGSSLMAPAFSAWTLVHFLFIFTMWAVMMVGMMTPTVAPMVLLYARVGRHATERIAPTIWFVAGYLAAWTLFAALAALAQWGLEALALLTPMMASASHRFGGAVLLAAGIYQWLPMKDLCLAGCRAPLSFMQRYGGFQASARGSLRLGLLHGSYCVGCCWVLMLLLFVVGVMNPLWIAALMVFALLEKVMPGGRVLSRIAGCAAIGAGIWMTAVS